MFYKCVFFTSSFMVPLKCIPGEQWLLKNWSEVVGSLNCKRYLMSKVVNQGIHSELESWYEIELLYHVQFQFSMNRSLCSRKTPWWPAISFLVRRHSPGARSSFFFYMCKRNELGTGRWRNTSQVSLGLFAKTQHGWFTYKLKTRVLFFWMILGTFFSKPCTCSHWSSDQSPGCSLLYIIDDASQLYRDYV